MLDQHHGVMAQLGERFLLHRITVANARKQGLASRSPTTAREREMRRRTRRFRRPLHGPPASTKPPPITPADTSRLVDLANLVSRARSPVVRDRYRREIELVPDSEAPGRIVGGPSHARSPAYASSASTSPKRAV